MINVEMHGRLGNQLFQYATARSLQEKTHQPMQFSFRTINTEKDKEGNTGWEDSLKLFRVKEYKTYVGNKSVLFLDTSIFQKLIGLLYYSFYKPILVHDELDFQGLYRFQKKWQWLLSRFGIWWMKQGYYHFVPCTKCKTYVLNGGFESRKYFDDVRDILRSEIVPIQELNESDKKMISYLQSVNSVCISIRHFDLSDKRRDKLFNVCSVQYYKKAIDVIKGKIQNPVFYICSDNQEWVKSQFDFSSCDTIFENPDNNVSVKLYLMTKCKHFIISNSTFSWWAQYLGNYDGKVVVAPTKWYNSDFESELLNDNTFIKI